MIINIILSIILFLHIKYPGFVISFIDDKNKLKTIKSYIDVLYGSILYKLKIKRSTKKIPVGPYCYTGESYDIKTGIYHIKPCKYYKYLLSDADDFDSEYRGCSYLGEITEDYLFIDQCKMCSENYGRE